MLRILVASGCLLAAASLPAQPAQNVSLNMILEARVDCAPCTTTDVHAIGDYALLARRHLGFTVVDLRDISKPVAKTIAPTGYPVAPGELGVGDIKADSRYIYVTSESVVGGVYIFDAGTDPMNPQFVSFVSDLRLRAGVHNCWVDGDILYCASNFSRRVELYDIKNRAAPVWLSSLGNSFNPILAHDVMVKNGRAYCSLAFSGIAIYDVTNPSRPFLIGSTAYSGNATHNMWPTEDEKYLYTTDEIIIAGVGGAIRIWDIQNLPAIRQVGQLRVGPSSSLVHNVYVRGDMLFVAYYTEGVRVFSIKDPKKPVEIAYYDTYLPTGPGCLQGSGAFSGCWGVHPWDREHILASDVDSGLYVMRLDAVGNKTQIEQRIPGASPATVRFGYDNRTPATVTGFGMFAITQINGVPVFMPLVSDVREIDPAGIVWHDFEFGPYETTMPMRLQFTGLSGTANPFLAGPLNVLNISVR